MIVLFAISLPIVLKLPIRPQHIGLAIIVSLTLVYLVLFGLSTISFFYDALGCNLLGVGRASPIVGKEFVADR